MCFWASFSSPCSRMVLVWLLLECEFSEESEPRALSSWLETIGSGNSSTGGKVLHAEPNRQVPCAFVSIVNVAVLLFPLYRKLRLTEFTQLA